MKLNDSELGGFSDSITGIFTGIMDTAKAVAPSIVQYQLAKKGIQPVQQVLPQGQVQTAYGPYAPSQPPAYTQYGQPQAQYPIQYGQAYDPNQSAFGVDVGNPQYASRSDNTLMYVVGGAALLLIVFMARGKK